MRASNALLAAILTSLTLAPGCGAGDDEAPVPDAVLVLRRRDERERLEVYLDREKGRGFFTIGQGEVRFTSPVLALFKVMTADVDGDGDDEIVLGILSRTKRHDEPSPHRTLWVMSWDGSRLSPRWRGSALARPLLDAVPFDADGDGRVEVLAAERAKDVCSLTLHRWNGFGFSGIATTRAPCPPTFVEKSGCIRDGRGTKCVKLVDRELRWE